MIRVRVSFDTRDELKEALEVVESLKKCFSRKYGVVVNERVYWNTRERRRNRGGRIYIVLKPRRS